MEELLNGSFVDKCNPTLIFERNFSAAFPFKIFDLVGVRRFYYFSPWFLIYSLITSIGAPSVLSTI